MKKWTMKIAAVAAAMVMTSTPASAQGFLKKLAKGVDKVSSALDSASGKKEATDTAEVKALKWDEIPVYEIKKVVATTSDGSIAKNEDGTPLESYQLVDQFGNVRSAAYVKEQQKKINKAVGNILLKVGGGAAVGVAGGLLASKGKASGGIIGGVAGAAAGLALSANDIKRAKELKKQLKEQDEKLAQYEKTFTAEGKPIAADAQGMANVDGLVKGETLSLSAEKYKSVLSSPDYASADNWEVPTV